MRSGAHNLKANENTKFHGNHLSGSLQSEEAARVHALKVVEVLKNEIKVNEDIFFDAVDHSMQNEESKMMKMKNGRRS